MGSAALSRAIKEAAAAGVKVAEARRLLKLQQGLEAAMAAAAEAPLQYQALKVLPLPLPLPLPHQVHLLKHLLTCHLLSSRPCRHASSRLRQVASPSHW